MRKQKKTIKEEITEILEDFYLGYTPNSGRKGMYHWRDKILNVLHQTIQRFIEETKLIKMDYLKWQLRKDLTGRYHTIDLEKATERAKGWNAFKDKLNQKQAKWLKENL